MREFDRVSTRPEVTLFAIERFVSRPERHGTLFQGRYAVWTSSGTTGHPGWFVHDPGALAVYDALEAQRFRGVGLARSWRPGERYAMVAATGGHFAGVSSVERMRRSVPWLAPFVRSCSLMQPVRCAGGRTQCVPAGHRRDVPDRRRDARRGAGERAAAAAPARGLDRRRVPGARDARPAAVRLRLPGPQFLRRVGVPADRLGVRAPEPARQQRLGDPRTGRRGAAAGRAGDPLALGAADQSRQPRAAADSLRPRRRRDAARPALCAADRPSRRSRSRGAATTRW